jgi:hypothetical protein
MDANDVQRENKQNHYDRKPQNTHRDLPSFENGKFGPRHQNREPISPEALYN